MFMKRVRALLFVVAASLAGCSGGGNQTIGQVSGIIQDINGRTVIDARVYVSGGPQTYSNSAGSYILADVHGDQVLVKAAASQDGYDFYGETVAQIFDLSRSKSTNITVVRNDQRATLKGTVRDRNGFLVQGAHIFAIPIDSQGNPLVGSSTMALSDGAGRFQMTALQGSQDYRIHASALGYDSDSDTVNILAHDILDLDFTLKNPSNVTLPAPTNLSAVAWTSPHEATRSFAMAKGIEAVKRTFDSRLATSKLRKMITVGGNDIEIDLAWDSESRTDLLGYGIYRGFGDVGYNALSAVDFYRDPLANLYEDAEDSFREFETYSYAITALNTNFSESDPSTESAFSNRVTAKTLSDLNLNVPVFGPLTFRWQAGSGAEQYTVYVYDRFPSVDLTGNNYGRIWFSNYTPNTQIAYGGPALQSGQTYYYVVIGVANNTSSISISVIDSFIAP